MKTIRFFVSFGTNGTIEVEERGTQKKNYLLDIQAYFWLVLVSYEPANLFEGFSLFLSREVLRSRIKKKKSLSDLLHVTD